MDHCEFMILMKALGIPKENIIESCVPQLDSEFSLYDYKGNYIGTSEIVTLDYSEDTHKPFTVLFKGTKLNKGKTKKDIKMLQVTTFGELPFLDTKEYRVLSTSLSTLDSKDVIKGLAVESYNKVLEGN